MINYHYSIDYLHNFSAKLNWLQKEIKNQSMACLDTTFLWGKVSFFVYHLEEA